MHYKAKRNDSTCLSRLGNGKWQACLDGLPVCPETDFATAMRAASTHGISVDAVFFCGEWVQIWLLVNENKNKVPKGLQEAQIIGVSWDGR